MRLTHRNLEPADIDAHVARVTNRGAYEGYRAGLWECVPGVWRSLVETGAMRGDVLIDLDRPAGSQVVGFGAAVFVTDEFVHEAESSMPPFVRAQLIERILQGRSPVLSMPRVRDGAGGLNLFVLEDLMSVPDLSVEETGAVLYKGIEVGLRLFRCFPLRTWMSESYRSDMRPAFEAAGLIVRRDYAEHFRHASHAPPERDRPYLFGITRDEAAERFGSAIAPLFLQTTRRYFFRPVEQALLRRALLGETDEELAASESVSLSAIKKRWRAVYDRVERTDMAAATPYMPAEVPEGRRGVEKRRHLLNYLREHPEELQPNVP